MTILKSYILKNMIMYLTLQDVVNTGSDRDESSYHICHGKAALQSGYIYSISVLCLRVNKAW